MDIIRLAKSDNQWSMNNLLAYNIFVERPQNTFFGGPLTAYTRPASLVPNGNCVQGLNVTSFSLIKHLDVAMKIMEGEKSVMDDFSKEILWVLGYEMEYTVIHMKKNL